MVAIANADIEDVLELSGLQQSMLYTSLSDPSGGHYIEQFLLEFTRFDPRHMQTALSLLIERHWALRSLFVWREQDSPRLVVLSQLESALNPVEFANAKVLLADDRARGFLLDQESPIRFTYAPTADSGARCVLTFHHAAVDGWSIANLTHELLSLYGALLNDLALPLPNPDPKPQAVAAGPGQSGWEAYLQDSASPTGLANLIAPSTPAPDYAELQMQLSPAQTESVSRWCKQQRVTLSSLIHCVWGVTLGYLNGTTKVIFGSVDSGRATLADGESAVGMFMSLLPVKVQLQPGSPFAPLVSEFQSAHWTTLRYPPPDPGWLASCLNKPSSAALFDSVLIIQNYPQPAGWDNIHLDSLSGHEQADVPLVLAVGAGANLTALFRYQTHRLDESAVTTLSGIFSKIILKICVEEVATLGELYTGLGESAGGSVVESAQVMENSCSDRQWCIDEFSARVEEQPHAIALVSPEFEEVSYLRLSYKAECIRQALNSAGVVPAAIVGLRLARGIDAVAAMLAVIAQDAIYLPLDPGYPEARLEQMIQQAQPVLVVDKQFVQSALKRLEPSNTRALAAPATPSCEHMCLLFTSGSTGNPKGVMLTHSAVRNRLTWQAEEFPAQPDDVFCMRTPLSFVDSVSETFLPLVLGATSVLIDEETLHSLRRLRETLQRHAVSRVLLVPSLLRVLLDELQETGESLPNLRQCVVSGEALTTALALQFRQLLPSASLLNFYGSTEVMADALWYEPDLSAESADCVTTLVPIGRPIRQMSARLVNALGYTLPPMVVGELAIAGVGVAAGYYSFEESESNRFSNGEFLTGDLAHRDNQGVLHFHGRSDRQVQIAGRRVEPAEVERTLCELEGIRAATVWLYLGRLVAVFSVTGEYTGLPCSDEVASHLQNRLPPHMVPTRVCAVTDIPLLASGKRDQAALEQIIAAADVPPPGAVALEAPDGLEEIALEIVRNLWQEMLSMPEIHGDTHFFDAGGGSLLAMQMLARLERSLNREIPLKLLIDSPTLSGLAQALCAAAEANSNANLVTLRERSSSSEDSILCIHGDAYNLPRLVSGRRPIFWLSQWQLRMELAACARVLSHESVEEMADRYAGYLERVDLGARTTIVAACAAAVVAIEVARILKARGINVHLLLMDLPGGKLQRLPGKGHTQAVTEAIQHGAEASPVRTSQRRQGTSSGLLGRALKFARFRLRQTLFYQRYLVAKSEQAATSGASLTQDEALAYCNSLLNLALVNYELSSLELPVELIWSKQWGANQAGSKKVILPKRWVGAFANLTATHFSPANVHNDLLQGDGAEFVARLLNEQSKSKGF